MSGTGADVDVLDVRMYVAPSPGAVLVSVPDAGMVFTFGSDDPEGLIELVRSTVAAQHGFAEKQVCVETLRPANVLDSGTISAVVGAVSRIGAQVEVYTSEQAMRLCILMTNQHLGEPPIAAPTVRHRPVLSARLHAVPKQSETEDIDQSQRHNKRDPAVHGKSWESATRKHITCAD